MDTTIDKIIALAEPSRPEVFRRYLTSLDGRALHQKLADLEADRQGPARTGHWQHGRPRPTMEVNRG